MSALVQQMPSVKHAPVNGIDMAYYEVGPREGVPVVFCHGFPELAFSWRHQLKAFEAAGRWAIAPDQRGYGLTSRPDAVDRLRHGAPDRRPGRPCSITWAWRRRSSAATTGAGWSVWQLPLMHPRPRRRRASGSTRLSCARAPIDPIAGMRAAFGEDMYIVWFQKPGEADAALAADVDKTMRFFMRKPRGDR